MPNWCMNDLRISGNADEILSFIEDNKTDGEFCFKTLVPEPEYKNSEEWYDWRLSNWGTKWDVDGDVDVNKLDDGLYRLYFTTAWSPPIQWFETVIKSYPTLKFELHAGEPGMNWNHVWQAQGGMSLLFHSSTFEDSASFWGVEEMVV
jgi:Ferredoxin-like domain in Api92-like protein